MKYKVRRDVWEGPNVSFNPKTGVGLSYGWWEFVKVLNNKVVFNPYSYSNSTSKHQRKMRELLRSLGIKIDLEIECPQGLQSLTSGLDYYQCKIDELRALIAKPRTKREKNLERLEQIDCYKAKIKLIEKLLKKSEAA